METLSARVTGYDKGSTTYYTTEVHLEDLSWTLRIRYSKFHSFYTKLHEVEKDFEFEFPTKGGLFWSPSAKERLPVLDDFVQKVVERFQQREFPEEMEQLLDKLFMISATVNGKEQDDMTETSTVTDGTLREEESTVEDDDGEARDEVKKPEDEGEKSLMHSPLTGLAVSESDVTTTVSLDEDESAPAQVANASTDEATAAVAEAILSAASGAETTEEPAADQDDQLAEEPADESAEEEHGEAVAPVAPQPQDHAAVEAQPEGEEAVAPLAKKKVEMIDAEDPAAEETRANEPSALDAVDPIKPTIDPFLSGIHSRLIVSHCGQFESDSSLTDDLSQPQEQPEPDVDVETDSPKVASLTHHLARTVRGLQFHPFRFSLLLVTMFAVTYAWSSGDPLGPFRRDE